MTTKNQQIQIFNKDVEIIKRRKKQIENVKLKILINKVKFTVIHHYTCLRWQKKESEK